MLVGTTEPSSKKESCNRVLTLRAGLRKVVPVSGDAPPRQSLERGNTVTQPTQPTQFRRAVVNGKLLSVKQTVLFDKYMKESENFRTRFMQLSSEVSK